MQNNDDCQPQWRLWKTVFAKFVFQIILIGRILNTTRQLMLIVIINRIFYIIFIRFIINEFLVAYQQIIGMTPNKLVVWR